MFRKFRVCFKAETTSDTDINPQNDEVNVENRGPDEPRTMVGSEFDIFLSFRGEDTRKRFTDHLYEGLRLRGISTFRDSEGLKKGENIKKLLEYIEKSKICIPIISEGYADSKWCLRELAKVVECKKKVIPVFFEVDPSDVKNQSGCFAFGFKKHVSEGKVKQEEVIKWREALTKVGNISGFTLKDTNWMEGKLVQIIVKRILQELSSHHHHVGDYIIGHESHLKKLMRVLDLKSNDVRVIGIHGMGGIGKTTLVNAVHNKIYSEFEAFSFLSNVREAPLVSLQQKLLRDIFQYDETITNESNGIHRIKEKIGKKKVLIVLDDVDSKDQLQNLVGRRDWFREGSRIIITTRDTKTLNNLVNRDELYELRVLNDGDSKKLFCYHAFGNEKPSISNEYAEMCDEAVSFIKGLPLALEVLGSQFFDLKTEKEWRGWLERLKDCQDEGIFKRLKLSYDSLKDSEKKVFLDIACFFVSKRRRRDKYYDRRGFDYFEVDDMKAFWEECGFHPEPAINVLKHKSLIKIHERKGVMFGRHFEMHDQIRDMGRKIVEDEEKEGKPCSRLWNNSKVIKILRKQRVPTTTTIEGIMFQGEEEASDFNAPCLQEMNGLRLLHVRGAKCEGFPHFPEDLKWLALPNCQHFPMPPSVSIPGEVAVLNLYKNNNMADVLLDKCISRSMVFGKLKVLDLSWTRITMTPDFSMMPQMVKLTFEYCTELVEVHESVGQLKNLVRLSLGSCGKLEKLPDTICQVMKKLKTLDLCAKQIIVTPDFSFSPYLEELFLRNCEMLTEVHDSVGTLENLWRLEIKGCNALEGLPHTICQLTLLGNLKVSQHFDLSSSPEKLRDMELLKNLGLRETGIKSILTSIEKLTQLKHLNLQKSCPQWGNFKGIVLEVPRLEISGSCSELVTALSSSHLHSVLRLVITDDQIESLPDSIEQMQNLEYLKLKCQSLRALPKWIGQLKQLRTFALDCDNIPLFIDEMCSWEHIEIKLRVRCLQLEPVTSSIEELKNVKSLKLGCSSLETLPDCIASLGGLRQLSLSGCKNMKHLPNSMRQMGSMERLDLSETGILELPPWLGCFTNLEHLKLRNITQNDVLLSGLSHLTSLEELDLLGSNFKKLPSCISSFSRLKMLNVSGCKQLHTIPHLSSSVLWKLDASNCTNLRCLPDFSNLQSLSHLFLGGCNSLECIPGFETIAEHIWDLELPWPSGGIHCSNLSNDFNNNVFMQALFGNLWRFKMGGKLTAGSHSGQQSMSFLFPDVRFCHRNECYSLKLILDGMISSPVDMAVVMEDDHVLFEMRLAEDDFDNDDKDSKACSFEGGDEEILRHLQKGSGTILVSTDVSKLSKVELEATYWWR